MPRGTLEVTLISAKDLKDSDFFNGLGNTFLPPPKGEKIEKSACEFLVEKVFEYPGEVSVLAPTPLTNCHFHYWAIKGDFAFASKVKRIVILGGAFLALGNVNPVAEANHKIYKSSIELLDLVSSKKYFVS
ncbi:Uridine nucleosidase 1 [Glycine soja]|uniref:Uridine nucleosidase 1 n=1 Tax=Glycine soja TaxID=3848 RepID=A0A0B2PAH3_GLYSO|nr:Uridine nucleosidase 1 [Glycine soja]